MSRAWLLLLAISGGALVAPPAALAEEVQQAGEGPAAERAEEGVQPERSGSKEEQRVARLKEQILRGEQDHSLDKLAPYLGRGY